MNKKICIDVVVHAYYTEALRLTQAISTGRKTAIWREAIGQLSPPDDYLVFVRLSAHPIQPNVSGLINSLMQHARGILGDNVLECYGRIAGADITERLGNPEPGSIRRIRGYGETYHDCVENITYDIAGTLGIRKGDSRVALPKRLSVPWAFDKELMEIKLSLERDGLSPGY